MTALALDPLTLAYHELRSPLGFVATALRSVAEDSLDEGLRHRCDAIVRTVERMLRTSGQVSSLARADAPVHEVCFAPSDILYQIASDLSSFDMRVDVQATTEALETEVRGAPTTFETLIQSLVSNAIDHSDRGANVNLACAVEDRSLIVSITNAIASQRQHHGLGAGLYLCNRLAEQLGAQLTAGAEDGVFHVSLRLASCSPMYP